MDARPLIALVALLGLGCADYALSAAEDSRDSAASDQDDTLSLRIDVYPSDELASDALAEGVSLMAQSFHLEDRELDALGTLLLQAPVTFEGFVTGFEAYPSTAEVGVPGDEAVPVEAELRAYVPGTPMGRTVVSDGEDGSYTLQITPSERDYELAVVPRDPVLLPFLVEPELVVDANDGGPLDFQLDYGVPLYGRITQGDVSGALEGLVVRAVDVETGVAGPDAITATDGTYQLRVSPGTYWLEVDGDAGSHLPQMTLLAEVVDEDAGLRLDVAYGAAAPVTVDGGVTDAAGQELGDVLVRFTSEYLPDHPDGSFVVETTTGSNGRFSMRVVPGDYRVEFIPSYAGSVGPMAWPETVELYEGYTELGDAAGIVLEDRPVVRTTMNDVDGHGAANVIVRAQELSFDGYAYSTVTGNDGSFSLGVAEGGLSWTFTPAVSAQGAATFWTATADEVAGAGEVELEQGLTVAGDIAFEDVPAAFMPFDVRDSSDRLYATGMTDIDGRFSLKVAWDQQSPDEAHDTGD